MSSGVAAPATASAVASKTAPPGQPHLHPQTSADGASRKTATGTQKCSSSSNDGRSAAFPGASTNNAIEPFLIIRNAAGLETKLTGIDPAKVRVIADLTKKQVYDRFIKVFYDAERELVPPPSKIRWMRRLPKNFLDATAGTAKITTTTSGAGKKDVASSTTETNEDVVPANGAPRFGEDLRGTFPSSSNLSKNNTGTTKSKDDGSFNIAAEGPVTSLPAPTPARTQPNKRASCDLSGGRSSRRRSEDSLFFEEARTKNTDDEPEFDGSTHSRPASEADSEDETPETLVESAKEELVYGGAVVYRFVVQGPGQVEVDDESGLPVWNTKADAEAWLYDQAYLKDRKEDASDGRPKRPARSDNVKDLLPLSRRERASDPDNLRLHLHVVCAVLSMSDTEWKLHGWRDKEKRKDASQSAGALATTTTTFRHDYAGRALAALMFTGMSGGNNVHALSDLLANIVDSFAPEQSGGGRGEKFYPKQLAYLQRQAHLKTRTKSERIALLVSVSSRVFTEDLDIDGGPQFFPDFSEPVMEQRKNARDLEMLLLALENCRHKGVWRKLRKAMRRNLRRDLFAVVSQLQLDIAGEAAGQDAFETFRGECDPPRENAKEWVDLIATSMQKAGFSHYASSLQDVLDEFGKATDELIEKAHELLWSVEEDDANVFDSESEVSTSSVDDSSDEQGSDEDDGDEAE
ncbi:unnamed protein product [Amoebophrya sp. A120]|nr:unnamed protein product [Amoebophrya sp. A120]|eukprot:GSA120T00017612001.1